MRRRSFLQMLAMIPLLRASSLLSLVEKKLWLGPNYTSRDMLSMFKHPEMWQKTLDQLAGFKFYTSHVTPFGGKNWLDPSKYPPLVEKNILPNFIDVDAFHFLNDRGINLTVEGGAVKPGNPDRCSGSAEAESAIAAVNGVRNNGGGRVDYFSMDEPLMGGTIKDYDAPPGETLYPCNLSLMQTLDSLDNFLTQFHTALNPNAPLLKQTGIILIEPYPRFSVHEIMRWIDLIRSRGQVIDRLHIDINFRESNRDHSAQWPEWVYQEMMNLKDFCHKSYRNIKFGLIFAGPDGVDDKTFFDYIMKSLKSFANIAREDSKKGIYEVDDFIFQSWTKAFPTDSNNPDHWKGLIPNNLPEGRVDNHPSYSLTYLANQGLRRLLAK